MTLVWGRPLVDGGAVATAELADLAVDQCVLVEGRFTLIAPDDYRGDTLDVRLFDRRGQRARARVALRGGRRGRRRGDGARGRDPHAAHAQGLRPAAGRPRDARRAARPRALGAQPPPDQPVALPRAGPGGARAPQGGGRAPRPPPSSTARRRWSPSRSCSTGDPVADEEDLCAAAVRRLHRAARRPRSRPGRLLAHARRRCARPTGAPHWASPTTSARSACCTSAPRARSSARRSACPRATSSATWTDALHASRP